MHNESRRGMLTKLGMGAAVITVAAAAGNAAAAPLSKLPPSKLPTALRTGIRVNPRFTSRNLQVRVAVTSIGVVLDAAVNPAPVVGLSPDNKVLQLGVILDGHGGVEVQGLNSLLNKIGNAAAGRCWQGLEKGETVSNPDPTFETINPKQMAQF
jgi:hypothetical protein